jgi:hypothetical protein
MGDEVFQRKKTDAKNAAASLRSRLVLAFCSGDGSGLEGLCALGGAGERSERCGSVERERESAERFFFFFFSLFRFLRRKKKRLQFFFPNSLFFRSRSLFSFCSSFDENSRRERRG